MAYADGHEVSTVDLVHVGGYSDDHEAAGAEQDALRRWMANLPSSKSSRYPMWNFMLHSIKIFT